MLFFNLRENVTLCYSFLVLVLMKVELVRQVSLNSMKVDQVVFLDRQLVAECGHCNLQSFQLVHLLCADLVLELLVVFFLGVLWIKSLSQL